MTHPASQDDATQKTISQESARDRVRRKRRKRKRRKVLRAVLVVLLVAGILGGGYAAGYAYFTNHYLPGTTVSGMDASGMTAEELTQALADAVGSYSLGVSHGSMDLVVEGTSIDLKVDESSAQTLLTKQDERMWLVSLLNSNNKLGAGITFDAQKLRSLVKKAVKAYNKAATAPQSAALVLNENASEFSLASEQPGTALSVQESFKAARGAVEELRASVVLGDEALQQPEVTKDSQQAQDALAQANAVFDLQIPLMRGEEQLVVLTSDTFGSWVVADGLLVGMDLEAASTYIANELWVYTDYSDDQNAYVVDANALAQKVLSFIRDGGTDVGTGASTVEVPYVATPLYLPGGGTLNPAGWEAERGRYIDINKTEQVACLYDASGKVLWETPVTTGNEKANNGTPVGEYDVYDKQSDFMLLGEDRNNDGEPDYERHVDFWMPFYASIGMHDASWRSVYGGDEYLENGSSGCVNLPHDAAAALYAIVHVGDAVIVHD